MREKSDLALRLKALRREKGVNSQTVADAVGIKSATYRRYEIDTKPRMLYMLRLQITSAFRLIT